MDIEHLQKALADYMQICNNEASKQVQERIRGIVIRELDEETNLGN